MTVDGRCIARLHLEAGALKVAGIDICIFHSRVQLEAHNTQP
jgi:hypothetical protein